VKKMSEKKMSEPEISQQDEAGVINESDEESSEITEEDVLDPSLEDTDEETPSTADKAVQATGADKAIEGLCQKAARLSWGCPAKYPSANAHWERRRPRHTSGRPPKGAYVFWNIGRNGHVGIADGNGGFWATSVKHKIGHAKNVGYYRNYRGWISGGCG
jgi:hypothetical protein